MKILFVCEGNVIRSQMAEAFLKHYLPDVQVKSAGTHVPPSREGAHRPQEEYPEVVSAMEEVGIDMSGAHSNRLTKDMLASSDRVILVGPINAGAPKYLVEHPNLEQWNVPDPGYGHADVHEARDMIEEKVKSLAGELRTL